MAILVPRGYANAISLLIVNSSYPEITSIISPSVADKKAAMASSATAEIHLEYLTEIN
ncbi:MAG: hypothetical protein HC899_11805 [Leptolyngbyaceae cyanobacterium SM1_4_3]|nr:hypothetical protein [Leptolyngbyaceae cyanobacterium SM1_4_3]